MIRAFFKGWPTWPDTLEADHADQAFTLVNFRGIEKMELDFEGKKTVALVGVNGVGKSSILDALAITLSV
jgi:recombinational DNA repair ATPase RecF